MLFRMILESAKDEERAIARGFLKHLIAGFAGGITLGALLVGGIFLMLSHLELNVPLVFIAAMILQFGPVGGLIGVGLYLSRITDRGDDQQDNEDEDDGPGGGTKAPVTKVRMPRRQPARVSLLPSPA